MAGVFVGAAPAAVLSGVPVDADRSQRRVSSVAVARLTPVGALGKPTPIAASIGSGTVGPVEPAAVVVAGSVGHGAIPSLAAPAAPMVGLRLVVLGVPNAGGPPVFSGIAVVRGLAGAASSAVPVVTAAPLPFRSRVALLRVVVAGPPVFARGRGLSSEVVLGIPVDALAVLHGATRKGGGEAALFSQLVVTPGLAVGDASIQCSTGYSP